MVFKPYYLGCLAHASYLIGGSNGDAAIVDPRRDVDEYIADAETHGLKIRYIIETHLHADFVSGHIELAQRTGGQIYLGSKTHAEFVHHSVRDGDSIDLGDISLDFLETPGHTPESITVLMKNKDTQEIELAFTGDTLFVGDVGRPDLVASRGLTPEQMARTMFRSLSDKLIGLPDSVEVWPAHGAGSACGKSLSDDRASTIGREKATNPALKLVVDGNEAEFVAYATEGLSLSPNYFSHDAESNRQGARTIEDVLSHAKAMTPQEFEEQSEDILVLDTRTIADFGSGHVPGAINVQLEGKFAPWVGNVILPGAPILLVTAVGEEEETIIRLCRIGYDNIVGYLQGGMDQWRDAKGELVTVPQVSPSDLEEIVNSVKVLDVRSIKEWEAGHIQGAVNIPLPELQQRIVEIPDGELYVICGSGYRSSIACSLLQRAGHRDVKNITGGWTAWSEYIARVR